MSSKELPHYNALDGLRGVAVSMVVLFHFWQTLPQYRHPLSAGVTRALGLMLIGQKGVDLFFVLSGFLITGILLRTKGSSNYFSTFYIRRSLRIFPLYFMVVIACLLAGAIWQLPQYSWHNTWWYLLYLQNIARTFWPDSIDGPGHFWSLAVEEHYYLFWPLAVLLASRRALIVLCVFLILMPIVMRAWFLYMGLDVFTITLCLIDTLAMGSFIAVLFENSRQRAAMVRYSRTHFRTPIVLLSFWVFRCFVLSRILGPDVANASNTLCLRCCAAWFWCLRCRRAASMWRPEYSMSLRCAVWARSAMPCMCSIPSSSPGRGDGSIRRSGTLYTGDFFRQYAASSRSI